MMAERILLYLMGGAAEGPFNAVDKSCIPPGSTEDRCPDQQNDEMVRWNQCTAGYD